MRYTTPYKTNTHSPDLDTPAHAVAPANVLDCWLTLNMAARTIWSDHVPQAARRGRLASGSYLPAQPRASRWKTDRLEAKGPSGGETESRRRPARTAAPSP